MRIADGLKPFVEAQRLAQDVPAQLFHVRSMGQPLAADAREHLVHGFASVLEVCVLEVLLLGDLDLAFDGDSPGFGFCRLAFFRLNRLCLGFLFSFRPPKQGSRSIVERYHLPVWRRPMSRRACPGR